MMQCSELSLSVNLPFSRHFPPPLQTTKEIKKARARVMKEEAEKKAAEAAAATAAAPPAAPAVGKPHSASQVRFHDSTTFLQSPSSSFTAANIMRNLDSAKKAVNASSKSLAERLIGISEKRKIHLSRRRNSIKEKTLRAASELVLDSPGIPNFGNTTVNASFNSTAPRLSYPVDGMKKNPVKVRQSGERSEEQSEKRGGN